MDVLRSHKRETVTGRAGEPPADYDRPLRLPASTACVLPLQMPGPP